MTRAAHAVLALAVHAQLALVSHESGAAEPMDPAARELLQLESRIRLALTALSDRRLNDWFARSWN